MIGRRVNLTPGKEEKVQERRTEFFKSLGPFRVLQATFMPVVSQLVSEEEEERKGATQPVLAENVVLWLPSQIPWSRRGTCRPSLFTMEEALRRAQCYESLDRVRLRLHARAHLVRFRNKNATGQKKILRARTLIDGVSDRIDAIARKYRDAQVALVRLVGEENAGGYKTLQPDDLTSRWVEDYNATRARRLSKIMGRESRLVPRTEENAANEYEADVNGSEKRGASRRKMSWIWTAIGAPDTSNDEYLHECKLVVAQFLLSH
jgi:hypothetical protein